MKEDLRFQKTELAIRESFFHLIEHKKSNEITVAEISRHALLGRGTFYQHYRSIEDLVKAIEDEAIAHMAKIYDQNAQQKKIENVSCLIVYMIDYFEKNKKQILLLIRNSNGEFTARAVDIFLKKYISCDYSHSDEKELKQDIIEGTFAICGFIGVINKWMSGEFDFEKKELIELLNNVLFKIYN
ncbi:TetR/AcrR family transcriptional regulator [Succinivibrio dextrinosolvens]|jgi:AcrR family transcriptional regulator|uniref:TetR/AcrR family transcriptional regulator n=1 Tax=Succinivibrio dextrinosolvens TaxID=83771 RepID=UPI00247B1A6F|nr:TetR/AcrR family transcriptional regulator [Succinivibrio dextrinosolvens]